MKPFKLEIMRSKEANQKNVRYKNMVILHGTLPHQVIYNYKAACPVSLSRCLSVTYPQYLPQMVLVCPCVLVSVTPQMLLEP